MRVMRMMMDMVLGCMLMRTPFCIIVCEPAVSICSFYVFYVEPSRKGGLIEMAEVTHSIDHP